MYHTAYIALVDADAAERSGQILKMYETKYLSLVNDIIQTNDFAE